MQVPGGASFLRHRVTLPLKQPSFGHGQPQREVRWHSPVSRRFLVKIEWLNKILVKWQRGRRTTDPWQLPL
jgi:hypothetical protein